MGLLNKIKGHFSSLLGGAKKVFGSAMKTFSKAMSNKWVRGALLVASLVVPVMGMASAGWASAAGQGIGAQMGSALSNVAAGVAKMVVQTVTTPIKMLLNGGSSAASMVGADGLATTLSSTATAVGNTATSIFGDVAKDSLSQMVARFNGAPGIDAGGMTGGAAGANAMPTDGISSAVDGTKTIQGAPQSQIMADASRDVSGVNLSGGSLIPSSVGAAAPTAAAPTGLLDRSLAFMQKNPELTKIAGAMVQGAMTPSEEDIIKERAKADAKYRTEINNQWGNFDVNQSGSPQAQPAAQPSQFQPIDYTQRGADARNQIMAGNQYQPVKSLLQKPAYMRNY